SGRDGARGVFRRRSRRAVPQSPPLSEEPGMPATGTPGPPQAASEPLPRAELPSAWAPLRRAMFRALWIASLASNVGTWMQSVAAVWLMTSLTPSPVMIALVQTAASAPLVLLGLPAGALADMVDRRK